MLRSFCLGRTHSQYQDDDNSGSHDNTWAYVLVICLVIVLVGYLLHRILYHTTVVRPASDVDDFFNQYSIEGMTRVEERKEEQKSPVHSMLPIGVVSLPR